jgi:hypothetical protein
MDFVATRTGDRTTVRHADRWTITHTAGARLADITDPDGQLVDTVQVVEWDWAPAEGGPSRAVGAVPATVDSLSAALLEYAQTHG